MLLGEFRGCALGANLAWASQLLIYSVSMRALIKCLMAAQLTLFVTHECFATESKHKESKDDVFIYVHSRSPQVMLPVDGSGRQNLYDYESYVVDLKQSREDDARTWTFEKLQQAKAQNPTLLTTVLEVFHTSALPKGRRPALSSTRSLVDQVAQLTGGRVQRKVVGNLKATGENRSTDIAVMLIERVNNVAVNWTFIEAKGISFAESLALANVMGSLSGEMQYTPTHTLSVPWANSKSMFQGYEKLLQIHRRIRNQTRWNPAPATVTKVSYVVRTAGEQVRRAQKISSQVAVLQIPEIFNWLHTQAYSQSFAWSLFNSHEPFDLFSTAARSTWDVAVKAHIKNQKTLTPELEHEIQKLSRRYYFGTQIGDRVISMVLNSGAISTPEAWIIMSFVGAASIGKLLWDYRNLVHQQVLRADIATATTTTSPTIKVSPETRTRFCREVLRRQTARPTSNVAGL